MSPSPSTSTSTSTSTSIQYSKLIASPDDPNATERVTVLIRSAHDCIRVGLYNHAFEVFGPDAALGFRLPPTADADAFVDALCEAYTTGGGRFTWLCPVMNQFSASYDVHFEAEVTAVAVEN